MKAYNVNELQNFKRSKNPHHALNIGSEIEAIGNTTAEDLLLYWILVFQGESGVYNELVRYHESSRTIEDVIEDFNKIKHLLTFLKPNQFNNERGVSVDLETFFELIENHSKYNSNMFIYDISYGDEWNIILSEIELSRAEKIEVIY